MKGGAVQGPAGKVQERYDGHESSYISAMPVLAGSTIGAMAPFATTWLTQHYQGLTQRLNQAASRREQLFGEFIGHASKTYIDAVVQEILDDPTKLVSLYAILNKLRAA